MFKNQILATPFSSDFAVELIGEKIFGTCYGDDVSFLSTLRALLFNRIGDGVLQFAVKTSDYVRNSFLNAMIENDNRMAVILYQEHESAINDMEARILNTGKFTRNEKVTAFFKKRFYASGFVNMEQKNTIILMASRDIRDYHYLQAGMFAFLPWYFNKEDGVDEIDVELCRSLRETTSDHYLDCLNRIAENYNFKEMKIRKYLTGFEARTEQIAETRMQSEVSEYISRINEYSRMLAQCIEKKRLLEEQLFGIHQRVVDAENNTELSDYFSRSKNVTLESADTNSFTFGVRGYLDFFNPDLAEDMINNKRSVLYTNSKYTPEQTEALFRAIFVDMTIKLRVCAAYRIYADGNVDGLRAYPYGSDYVGYMPNTHIDRYGCIGTYERAITDNLANGGSYTFSVDQAVASCHSLNFDDFTVMSSFVTILFSGKDDGRDINTKALELPDGRIVTPHQAIKYLMKEEEENNG